jgi:hypothetical protein
LIPEPNTAAARLLRASITKERFTGSRCFREKLTNMKAELFTIVVRILRIAQFLHII